MKKSTLERFISKYNLSGAADGVTWKADKTGLQTEFVSDDKHVIGNIKSTGLSFDPGNYSIYDTAALRGLLGVLEDDIDVTANKTGNVVTSLTIKDDSTKVTFVLSSPDNIPAVPAIKSLPAFENVILLDAKFVERFVKAKSALADVETFTVVSDGKKVDVVIGYDNNNTNRVTIAASTEKSGKIDPIDFHARYMKDILVANKEAKSGKLEVSSEGLARITFVVDEFDITYYLPQVKREN
jgi:hypothetical protein